MFQKTFVCVLTILVVSMAPAAYAGKTELTTYYPAPYGEYKNVTTTDDTTLATATGSVTVGTTTTPLPDATKDNTLTLRPVTGDASAQTGGEAGSLRYSADAGGTGVGGVLIRDGSGWNRLQGASPKCIGATSNTYSGLTMGGYVGGDAKCAAAFPGSRMCSSGNFINGLPTVEGWYSSYSNAGSWGDCVGWTCGSGFSAMYWSLSSPQTQNKDCGVARPILCCK